MQGLGYCGMKRRPWFCVSLAEESLNLRSEMQGIGTSDLAYTSNRQEVPEPRDQENIANYVWVSETILIGARVPGCLPIIRKVAR